MMTDPKRDTIARAQRGLVALWLRKHPVGQELAKLYPTMDTAIDRVMALIVAKRIFVTSDHRADFVFSGYVPPELLDADGNLASPVLRKLVEAQGQGSVGTQPWFS